MGRVNLLLKQEHLSLLIGKHLTKIKLNGIPLIQAQIPDCPTCSSLLATGYGIENANCKELLEIQEKLILTM